MEADLIVHVRDITHTETAHQAQNVEEVLEQLGLDEERQSGTLEVWNKVDKLSGEDLDATLNSATRGENTLAISAVSGMGVDALLERIELELASEMVEDRVELEFSDGKRRSWLFDRNVVLSEQVQEGGYLFEVRWSQRDRERFRKL